MFKTLVEIHTSVAHATVEEGYNDKKVYKKMILFQFLTIGCVYLRLSELFHVVTVWFYSSLSVSPSIFTLHSTNTVEYTSVHACLFHGETASDSQIIQLLCRKKR